MRKRVLWFLVSLVLVVGFNMSGPLMDRASMESTSVNTSLSVAPSGYKAVYLLLRALEKHPVSLWQHSMMHLDPQKPKTLWIVEPGEGLFFGGQDYANQMREQVADGGNVIVAVDAMTQNDEESMPQVLKMLNRWYDLSLKTETLDADGLDMAVTSHLEPAVIHSLGYREPKPMTAGKSTWKIQRSLVTPAISYFTPSSIRDGKVLLETPDGKPLALRFKRGRGTITVFPNSFYLGNGQLDLADNAALAVALQESVPAVGDTYFEVYSNGFNENRDIVTYLATGKGIALLLTLIFMLAGFCLWMIQQPLRRQNVLATTDERYFTQEVFIAALAQHYMDTRNWNALYRKMAEQFRREIDRRYPGLPLEDQLRHIGANPFFNVSHEALSAVFAKMNISSESEFIQKSQRLLDVRNLVSLQNRSSHEQSPTRAGGRDADGRSKSGAASTSIAG